MAVTATNTTPTTRQVYGSDRGAVCLRSRSPVVRATLSKWPRRDAHPGAAEIGRIRALTPRVPGSSFLTAPCWRDPSHTRSDGGDGTLRTSPDQGRLRSAFVHRSRGGLVNVECRSRIGRIALRMEPCARGPKPIHSSLRSHRYCADKICSPYLSSAFADRLRPSPGASFSVRDPRSIFGGFWKSSACNGSRSGSVNASTMQPAGVEATKCAWRKQSWCGATWT